MNIMIISIRYSIYMMNMSIMFMDDFNAQLGLVWGHRAGPRQSIRGRHLSDFLMYNNMYSVVSDSKCQGPIYTYGLDGSDKSPS